MPLTSFTLSRVRGVADESSLERFGGAGVDWSRVTAGSDGKKRLFSLQVVGRTADGLIVPRSFSATLTSVVVASNVATATLAGHGFKVGDKLTIAGGSLAYANGTITVVSVPDANTFTYAATGSNATATGTITASYTAQAIIETDANQGALVEAKTGYGQLCGGVLYESLMPDASGTPKVIPAAYKSELVAAGCTFKYTRYSDSRAS